MKKDYSHFKTEPNRFKAMMEDDTIFLGFLTVLYADISNVSSEYEHLRRIIRKADGLYGN